MSAPFMWTSDLDQALCEMVAEGLNFSAIGTALGLSRNAVTGRFRRIRESYGWQGK